MYKIEQLVLWPEDTTKEKRVINFSLDKVNIIHGSSRTGKTAVIACIDYALGCKESKIPVGEILEYTKWFGVVIKSNEEELLIARRNQNHKGHNENCFFLWKRSAST